MSVLVMISRTDPVITQITNSPSKIRGGRGTLRIMGSKKNQGDSFF